jgi:hypothetical protein
MVVAPTGAHNNSRTSSGSAYVVWGKSSTTNIDLNALGTGGYRIDGAAASDGLDAVANAGDVNGDGTTDQIVGAKSADPNGSNSGSAYVVFGKTSTTTVDLNALGGGGFRMDGASASWMAGSFVAGAGDVNGDGKADVAVSSPFAGNNSRASSGSVYLVFGKSSTTTVSLNAMSGEGYRIDGALFGTLIGQSIANAGDINADGRPDLLIGSHISSPLGRSAAGSAYVVYGKASTTNIDLLTINNQGIAIDGAASGDRLGGSVASAGDINGDGRAELLLGASAADGGGDEVGSVYVMTTPTCT